MRERKCPHANIMDCPLYHAMHIANAPSCYSHRLDEGLCKVDLGKKYEDILMALNIFDLRIASDCEWMRIRGSATMH